IQVADALSQAQGKNNVGADRVTAVVADDVELSTVKLGRHGQKGPGLQFFELRPLPQAPAFGLMRARNRNAAGRRQGTEPVSEQVHGKLLCCQAAFGVIGWLTGLAKTRSGLAAAGGCLLSTDTSAPDKKT